MEHRLPEPRRQHRQPAELPRHGDLHRRHGRDPELRADVGEHEGAVRHRRRAHPPRPHRSRDRRREDASRAASVDTARWPEQTYQVQSRVHFPAHARAVLHERDSGTSPATAISTACSTCSRAAAISTGTFTSELAGVNAYQLPVALRLAALDAERLRGLGRGSRVLRRRRALHVLDQAARRRRRARRTGSTPR